jgi:hypothetical protein
MRTQFCLRTFSWSLNNHVIVVCHLVHYIIGIGIIGVVAAVKGTCTVGSLLRK